MSRYVVTYDRDESGAWIAQVQGVPEAHTYGRTIDQARERVREALSLWKNDARRAEVVDEVHLPARASNLVAAVHKAKKRVEEEQIRAQKSASAAARHLTGAWGLSLRDAGELLGVSRQRVQQIRRALPESRASKAAAGRRKAGAGMAPRVYRSTRKIANRRRRRS